MKTGINFERCNISSCEVHNTRNKAYIAAVNASPNKKYSIFEDKTRTNISWVNPKYKDKTLPILLDELRGIYKEKVGQKPQEEDRVREITDKKTGMKKTVTTAGWSPIREGVCPITPDTTIEDFEEFIKWMREHGVDIIRIDLHHDEGHTDEETNKRKYNHHGHIVADWVNHATGKTAKLNSVDTSEMQTVLAKSLGMERGESKLRTGADHRTPDEQRAYAAAQQAMKLEARVQELEETAVVAKAQAYDTLQECCRTLQQLGKETVKNFDENCKSGAVNPTTKEQEYRDTLEMESRRDLSAMDESSLKEEQSLLREMIQKTSKAVERIGNKLQEIASNIPTFTLLPGRKNKLLAHEAEIKASAAAEVAKAESLAQGAIKAEEKARNAEERAKIREAQAADEKNKYQQLKTQLQSKIENAASEAKEEGYNSGYFDAEQEGHARVQKLEDEIQNMKQAHQNEIENLKKESDYHKNWKEYFRKTNPYLQNAEELYKELRGTKDFKFNSEEVLRLFQGEVVEKTFKITRNWKEYEFPVKIDISENQEGKMRVWYNDTTLQKCKEELQQQAIDLSRGHGKSMGGPS